MLQYGDNVCGFWTKGLWYHRLAMYSNQSVPDPALLKDLCIKWGFGEHCVHQLRYNVTVSGLTSMLLGSGMSSGTINSKGNVCALASKMCDLEPLSSSLVIGSVLTLLNNVMDSLSLSSELISPLNITRIWFVLVGFAGNTATVPEHDKNEYNGWTYMLRGSGGEEFG
jgi:hypothetical protein